MNYEHWFRALKVTSPFVESDKGFNITVNCPLKWALR